MQSLTPTANRKIFRTVKQESPLILSSAPHLRSRGTVAGRMWSFVLALLPVMIASGIVFGGRSFLILALSVISAICFEWIAEKIFKRQVRIQDGSVVLIAILFALNLPLSASWWQIVLGIFYAVFVGRELAGGLGQNRFHPSLFGAAVFWACFPFEINGDSKILVHHVFAPYLIGLGAVFLWRRRLIQWQSLLSYFIAVLTVSLVLGQKLGPVFLSGSTWLTAVFLITDSVTIPLTLKGRILFAIGAGLLGGMTQEILGLPSGALFAILLMNGLVPLIDRHVTISPSIRKI